MRTAILALTLVLLVACDLTASTANSSAPLPTPILACPSACEAARGAHLISCVQHAAHPRAGCMKSAQTDFGACLIAAGDVERGRIEQCLAECLFLAVTCDEQAARIEDSGYVCDQWRAECDAACVAGQR